MQSKRDDIYLVPRRLPDFKIEKMASNKNEKNNPIRL